MELDGVRAQKCNSDRVIVFQSAILQLAQGVNNSKNVRAHILFRIDLLNCGAFDELVKDIFNADTE